MSEREFYSGLIYTLLMHPKLGQTEFEFKPLIRKTDSNNLDNLQWMQRIRRPRQLDKQHGSKAVGKFLSKA